jgi:hypothetical protein
VCDPDFSVCLFECRDDEFEPNNELFQATRLDLVSSFEARICHDGDLLSSQDCFVLELFEEGLLGQTLNISLDFSRELGDLDILLIDPEFNEERSEDQEGLEVLEKELVTLGQWFFCVEPAVEAFNGAYSLSVEVLP